MKSKIKNTVNLHNKTIIQNDNKLTVKLMYFLVALLSFVIYYNTLHNGYVLDDFSVIKENWVIKRGTQSIPLIFKTSYRYGYWSSADELYRPLSLAVFATEWQIWTDNPKPGHFINILLYTLSCLLLFSVLRKIFYKYTIILPFVISLLFTLHPIHTEVVSNIKSLDEILCFLFLIITLFCALNYVQKGNKKWILFGIISYFLAFLSKESAITFLAVIPLTLYFFSNDSLKRNITFSALMLIPALLFLAIRAKVLANQPEGNFVSYTDNLLVAAPDLLTRFATAIKIMGKYLWKLLLPYPLVSDYSFNQITIEGWSSLWVILSFIIYLFFAVYSILKLKFKYVYVYSILFFIFTMSIYSNIVIIIGSSFGERFLFVPSLAFCIAITWFLFKILKINSDKIVILKPSVFFNNNKKIILIFLPIFLFYSAIVISRNKDWNSNLSLYSADIVKSPNSAHMRYYYGLVLMKDKALNKNSVIENPEYLDSAIFQFQTATKIVPTFADAYDQIGLAYFRKNMNDSALKYYQLSLKYNPTKAITYSNMGVIYFNNKEFDKALEVYQKAVKYDPAFSDAWMNLGSTLGTLGKPNEAIDAFKKCIEFNPQNATAMYYLGITYKSLNDPINSKFYIEQAAKLDSKFSQYLN